ncbi:hypothetical protein ACJJTC_007392 [Scirpophaga incertulas]
MTLQRRLWSPGSASGTRRCRRCRPAAPATGATTTPNDTLDCTLLYENYDTTFAEFNLGCHEWMRTLVGSVRNAALPLALILTGYTSDRFGRRTAFCIFGGFAGALGLLKSFSVSYPMYLTVEFLEAMLGSGFNSAGYVMMVELAQPKLRATFACVTGVAYGVGGAALAAAAVRWLHARGRHRRVRSTLRRAAVLNKVHIDEDILAALEKEHTVAASAPRVNPWLQLVRSRALVARLAATGAAWAAAAFIYYGLTINSVALSGDKYVNFALNMFMEVVASLLIVMALERFGRKRSIFSAFLICGFACVAPFFVSHTGTGLGLFFLGKLSVTFAFNSLYVFTAEVFPTGSRSSALATCSLLGRAGSVLAPQTPLLSATVQAALYAAAAVCGAAATLASPETRHAPLPQDATAAVTLGRRRGDATLPQPAPPPRRVLSADL